MKKLFLFLFVLLPLGSFAAEPLLLLNPSRETFLNFPSAVLPHKTVTVFLPEPAVPLHRAYPVVYILGAIPKDAASAQAVLAQANQKAILVGLNTTRDDLADPAKLVSFFTQELVPYIEANYPTMGESAFRAIVAQGPEGLQVVAALLAKKELFGRAVLLHTGEKPVAWTELDPQLRVWIEGTRAEVLALQQTLSEWGRKYGPDFVTRVTDASEGTLWKAIQLDYLFAPAEKVQVKKIKGYFIPTPLSIEKKEQLPIAWQVSLASDMRVDFIPLSLRMTPPYLNWNAQTGYLSVLSGAMPGKVKISVSVDKVAWSGKIKLKK